jgi:hypothetical protein
MSHTFRELAYEKQHNAPQIKDTYEALLEQVRSSISQNHAETLAHSITEKDAADSVRRIIGEYLTERRLHIDGLSMGDFPHQHQIQRG